SPSAPPASSPAPRLRARSTLSAGTEFFLAFWMASYSVGFPAGSPPPVRAATSTFLTSRANSLPRLASIAAFLCLVVAHLECPAMVVTSRSSLLRRLPLPDRRKECAGDPQVPAGLRVEGRCHQRALAHHLDPTAAGPVLTVASTPTPGRQVTSPSIPGGVVVLEPQVLHLAIPAGP